MKCFKINGTRSSNTNNSIIVISCFSNINCHIFISQNLSKNPAGFNQAVETVLEEESLIDVVLILNDNAQDGCLMCGVGNNKYSLAKNVYVGR